MEVPRLHDRGCGDCVKYSTFAANVTFQQANQDIGRFRPISDLGSRAFLNSRIHEARHSCGTSLHIVIIILVTKAAFRNTTRVHTDL